MTALDGLLLRRSEPEARAVLEDWLRENGRHVRSALMVGRIRADAYAYADAYADADAAADADAYADAAAYAAAADAADAAAADAADAAAAAYADADADADAAHQLQKRFINSIKNGETEMTEGFAILFSTGTYFSSCRMGWLRQTGGDEWEVVSARNVRRTANSGIMSLAQCKAAKGLGGHELGEVDTEPESVHRLHMLKAIRIPRADWPKWVKEFPALKDLLEAP